MASWRDGNKKGGKQPNQPGGQKRPAASRESSRTDWRSKKGGSSNRAIKSNKPWAEKQTDATAGKRVAYRVKLISAFVILAALVGGFIYYLSLQPYTLDLVVVAPRNGSGGTWYSTNGFASDAAGYFQRSNTHNKNLKVFVDDADYRERNYTLADPDTNWEEFLKEKKIEPSGPNGDVIAFYFIAPSVVKLDAEGNPRPYILPTSSYPLTNGDWVSVKKILEGIANWGPKGTKKLVMFDAQRIEPITSLGPMYDRFPSAVSKVFEEIDNEDLFVILSHDDGQQSWTAPELGGGTAFGYYARYGLLGAANITADDTTKDQIITFEEYALFMQSWVNQWVKNHRHAIQEPKLLFKLPNKKGDEEQTDRLAQADFDITWFVPGKFEDMKRSLKADSSYITGIREKGAKLDGYWNQYEQVMQQREAGSSALDKPLAASRAAALLIRAEQLFSVPESDEFESILNDELEIILDSLRIKAPPVEYISLATVENNPNATLYNEQRRTYLTQFYKLWFDQVRKIDDIKDDPAKKDELEKLQEALGNFETYTLINQRNIENIKDGAANKGKKLTRAEVAWVLWKGLVGQDSQPKLNDIECALKLLEHNQLADTKTNPEFVEIQFLKLLKENVDWDNEAHIVDIRNAVASAIRVRDRSESLLNECSPYVQYWIKTEFDRFEELRRVYEDKLLAGKFEDLPGEFDILLGEYEKLGADALSISNAKFTLDRARFELPYYTAWATREWMWYKTRTESNTSEELRPTDLDSIQLEELEELIEQTNKLAQVLDKWNNPGRRWGTESNDQAIAGAVSDKLESFKSKLSAKQDILSKHGTSTDTMLAIQRILMCPLVPSNNRTILRDKYIEISNAQFESGQEQYTSEKLERSKQKLPFVEFKAWIEKLEQKTMQVNFDPLKRDEFVRSIFQTEWANTLDEDQLRKFKAWCDSVPESSNSSSGVKPKKQQRADYGKIDTARRIGAATLAERKQLKDISSLTDVSTEIANIDKGFMSLWMAERALEDFWGDNEFTRAGSIPDATNPYFAKLARHYHQKCTDIDDEPEYFEYQKRYEDYREAACDLRIIYSGGLISIDRDSSDIVSKQATVTLSGKKLPKGWAYLYASEALNAKNTLPVEFESTESTRREPIDSQNLAADKEVGFEISSNVLKELSNTSKMPFSAVIAFRGHGTITKITAIHSASGPTLTESTTTSFRKLTLPPPTVKVEGDGRGTTDVMFIIDCSGSMDEVMKMGEGANAVQVERLFAAKATLKKLLEELKGNKELRIGLMAYGHRVSVKKRLNNKGVEVAVTDDNGDPVYVMKLDPESVDTYKPRGFNDDVELLHPLQPGVPYSDKYEYDTIIKDFLNDNRRLRPNGQTPLYAAILRAADAMRDEGSIGSDSIPKQIILLTDGVNQPWDFDVVKGVVFNDIDREVKNKLKNVTLHVAAYGMEDLQKRNAAGLNNTEQKELEKQKDLNTLVSKLGGTIFYTNDAEALKDHLEETVKIAKYAVVPGSSQSVRDDELLDLSATWRAQDPTFKPGEYLVKVFAKDEYRLPLCLYGGESLTVKYAEGRELSISSKDTDYYSAKPFVMGDGGRERRYQAQMLHWRPGSTYYQFQFVLRNENWETEMSFRPTQLMLEIVSKNSDVKTQIVQDYNYLGSRSYPVVEFGNVQLDEGEYYLRLYYVPFQRELDLNDFKEFNTDTEYSLANGRRANIKRTGDVVTVTITGGDFEGLNRMWVQMENVKSVRRRSQRNPDLVEHQFTLDGVGETDQVKLWMKEFPTVFNEDEKVEFSFEKTGN